MLISALLFGVPVAAEEPVSDDLIVFWAHNAIPLAVAGSEVCDRVTAVRDAMSTASGN